MRLLIVTQKVSQNDPDLGFFHTWLELFAQKYDSVVVVCLEKGEYTLPSNVTVLSLGKEQHISRLKYVRNLFSFVWKQRKNYDQVFVHMNPEYVVLVGWLWKLLGKKIGLWYVHRQMNKKIWIAEKFVDVVFSTAKESFPFQSPKLHITGHGIDTNFFIAQSRISTGIKRIISVGRITPIKNLEIILDAVHILKQKNIVLFTLDFIGSAITEKDTQYQKELEQKIIDLDLQNLVHFVGPTEYMRMPGQYAQSDLMINAAPTGGMDKAVLEAMCCAIPVLVCNRAFTQTFASQSSTFLYEEKNSHDLALHIENILLAPNSEEMGRFLRSQVIEQHNLSRLIEKIVSALSH